MSTEITSLFWFVHFWSGMWRGEVNLVGGGHSAEKKLNSVTCV